MGKKLKAGFDYSYLSHLKYSDGSEVKNVPVGFKCPQQPKSAGASSSGSHYGPVSSSSKNKNSNQGYVLDISFWKGDLYFEVSPTSTSKSFKPYSNFLSSISNVPTDDLFPCNISFYIQGKGRSSSGITNSLNADALLDSGGARRRWKR